MKIWRGWLSHAHEGRCYVWATSQRAARQLARNELDGDWHFEQIEVPTKKAELAEWLNKNFNRDNG